MSRGSILIVDYGLGNLFSIQRAIRALGAEPKISSDPSDVDAADRLILPGVGAFPEGMDGLNSRGLLKPIRGFADSGRPLLGVCLGMQLLLEESEEHGRHNGLGLVPGKVIRFENPTNGRSKFKIPHIGWNTLIRPDKQNSGWNGNLLNGLPDQPFMYFVHSYYVQPETLELTTAQTLYGKTRYCSVLESGNVMACQGHPELSGETGLQIYRNFLNV